MEASTQQIQNSGGNITDSNISVMTGLQRRDIKNIRTGDKSAHVARKNTLTRVIGRWQTDSDFVTKGGTARILSYGSARSQFNELVARVSKDLNPANVLSELERISAIERRSRGVALKVHSYVPEGDAVEGLTILSEDIDDFITGVEENIHSANEVPNLHVRTEYDNIPTKHLGKIRRWFIKEGHRLHQRARNYVARFDQDINPPSNNIEEGKRVVLTSFSYTEEE